MEANRDKSLNIFYVFILLIVFFTTGDLVSSFTNQTVLAFICSVLSGFFVFLGTYLRKKENIEHNVEDAVRLINSNFDKYNVILSILDIICSFIAIFTGIVIIGLIFRCAFALRIVIVLNKFKTVARVILVSAFIYLFKRNSKGETKMAEETKKEVKSSKLSKTQICSYIAAGVGIVWGIVSYFVPQLAIAGDYVYNLAISLGIEAVAAFVGTAKGYATRTEAEIEAVKEKQAVKDAKAKQKELEKAKAEVEKYERAKALVESASKDASSTDVNK